ncbi:MAG: fibronectin type III domain-containing protein, partial [Oscillospiraceae bacterium]
NTVPYFTNSLGVDREAFECSIILNLETGYSLEYNSAFTLGDSIIYYNGYDQSFIDRFGNNKIVGIKLRITPKVETTEDGSLTASDETLRSLSNGTNYYIYLSEVKPENVIAIAGDGWVGVVWNSIPGATEYVIMDGDSNVVAEGLNPFVNYYTITGLTNFKTYTYTVQARLGDGGWSAASDPVSATPTGNTIPQNVKATAGDGEVTLTWDAVNGATTYVIKDGGSTVLAKGIKDTTYTFTGLENGTTYTFAVYAYAGGKWNGSSAKVTATPKASYIPKNVKATAGDGEVTLTWDAVNGATTYVIKDGGTTVLAKNIKDTTYTITGLENGTTYTFTVYAYANGKWNGASAKVTATPKANYIPQNVRVRSAANGKVILVWDEVAGATAYVIKDGGTTILAKNIKDTTYSFTGLENGTTYTYTVYAYANGKWNGASEKVTATPIATIVPQNVEATVGDGEITLTWDEIEGATAYVIKDGGTTILAKNIKDTTYTFTGLENGTTYTYTVFAYANGKWSAASEKITATPEA